MVTCENFRSSQVWPFAILMDPRVKVQLPSESSSGSRVRTTLVPVKLQDRVMISCRHYLKTPVISFARRWFGYGKHQVGDESAACVANRQSVESTIRHAKLRGTEWTKCLDKSLCRHRCKLCWVNLMVT